VLVQALDASFPRPSERARRMLIFAGSRDKALAGMLEILAPAFDRVYLTSFQTSQRCETPEQLATLLHPAQRAKAVLCQSSLEAWRQARAEAQTDDLVCIAGSVFLAGELRPALS